MTAALIGESFYKRHTPWIDSIGFALTGSIGLAKMRALEWISVPLSHTEMALAGVVNGLASTLTYRLGNGDEASSSYHKVALTILGIGLGVITFPYITLKLLKGRATLITLGPVMKVALYHLAAKFFISNACDISESYYKKQNFPIFQDIEEMSPHDIAVFYQHFNEHPKAWEKEPFTKQLRYNRVLLEYDLEPLKITSIDLSASLTKIELETFKVLFEDHILNQTQATLLYNFHIAPQDRIYQVVSLPNIDPKKVKVRSLSNEQVMWHYKWIEQHPSVTIPQTQVEAFARRFYTLDLPPPQHPNFVAEVPFVGSNQVTSKAKALYHHGFFQKHPDEWKNLTLQHQILYRESFDNYRLEQFPLKEPRIEELSHLKKDYLKELKNHFETHHEAWNEKSRTYQLALNKALSILHIDPINLPTKSLIQKKHVKYVGFFLLNMAAWYIINRVSSAASTYFFDLAESYTYNSSINSEWNHSIILQPDATNTLPTDFIHNPSMSGCIGTACQIMSSTAFGFCPNPNYIPVNNSQTLSKVCKVPPSLHEIFTQKQPGFCIPKNPIITEAPLDTPFSIEMPCFPKDAPDFSATTFHEPPHHASASEILQSDSLRELKWGGAMVAGYLFTLTAYWAALRQRLHI